ncbi:MAG: polymer-forming cytoskeletal protein [Candidatus Mcinerneyibacterium aminivorans]|jgi:cytoskeletal protein CcmA (bactofilin family)|uniref:Polymer-forming cytoskeletal protein n=1 Tax=Candidatus Mcinerneyibacterium aminivorans TaxID=2703815 RepID=A0A5D0MIZ3_9BACT|nr:MAG: polymer-forming cytoskeletal protein [Candidatus Mcinerneyibacterium aminivorans]
MAGKNDEMKTVLGETSKIQGEMEVSHGISINGYFKGKLKSKGKILVGKNGRVEADVEAEEIVNAGFIDGEVYAKKKLIIHNEGEVDGSIKTSKLVLEKGGKINGRVDMGRNDKSRETQKIEGQKKEEEKIKKNNE